MNSLTKDIKYKSVDELISALLKNERSEYGNILRTTEISINELNDYASWSDECYTRNCITENKYFELILICWCKGHQTPIHDHGGEECWVKVIDGKFKETIYKEIKNGELEVVKSMTSKSGAITYMKDFMGFHKLENISEGNSLTLHLYAKPIKNCRAFNETDKTFTKRLLRYNNI